MRCTSVLFRALAALVLVAPVLAAAPSARADDPPPPPAPLPYPVDAPPAPNAFDGSPGPAPVAAPDAPPRLSPAQLEELVGPVALYPDVVLSSLLPATAFPLDLVAAARWVRSQGGKATAAPADATWDDSVKALLQFPDVLMWLDDNLGWLEAMGVAMATQQPDVLAAVQAFRQRAKDAGHLATDEHVVVAEQPPAVVGAPPVIVVEPAQPEIVYVPAYDPCAVLQPVVYYRRAPCITWSLAFGCGSFGAWSCYDLAWDCWTPGYGFGLFVYDAPCRWYEPRRSWYRSDPGCHRGAAWHPHADDLPWVSHRTRAGGGYAPHSGSFRTTRPSWSDRTTVDVRRADGVRPPDRSSPRFVSHDRGTASAPRRAADGTSWAPRVTSDDTRMRRAVPTPATDAPRVATGPATSAAPTSTSPRRLDGTGSWYRSRHAATDGTATTTWPRTRTTTPTATDATTATADGSRRVHPTPTAPRFEATPAPRLTPAPSPETTTADATRARGTGHGTWWRTTRDAAATPSVPRWTSPTPTATPAAPRVVSNPAPRLAPTPPVVAPRTLPEAPRHAAPSWPRTTFTPPSNPSPRTIPAPTRVESVPTAPRTTTPSSWNVRRRDESPPPPPPPTRNRHRR